MTFYKKQLYNDRGRTWEQGVLLSCLVGWQGTQNDWFFPIFTPFLLFFVATLTVAS